MSPTSILFAIVCFVVTFLDLIPLTWHFQASSKNVAIISLGLWLAQGTLFIGVNAVLWKNSIEVKESTYCDISKKLYPCLWNENHGLPRLDHNEALALRNALTFAAFAAPLCIAMQLEHIASPKYHVPSTYSKFQKTFEIILCIVLPCVYELLCKCPSDTNANKPLTLLIFSRSYRSTQPILRWYVFSWRMTYTSRFLIMSV